MSAFQRVSTLPLLGCFAFSALVLNNDAFFLKIGAFNLSPFDALFLAMVAVKVARVAEPTAYGVPRQPVATLVVLHLLTLVFLLAVQTQHSGPAPGDVFRDFRTLFYFLTVPFLCYRDISTHANYMTIHKFLIWSGVGVAAYAIGEQVFLFSIANPVRNLRIGIWVIPFAVVSLLYFQEQLGMTRRRANLMMLFMLVALVFSLHRSQYLQLAVSVVLASLLGGRVNAMRKAVAAFVPALIGASLVFVAIGYADVLIDRLMSINDLDNDSSYGARLQELEGQILMFHQAPLLGYGAGARSWVMGENGFELSIFSHNSWMFYLVKFGLIGAFMIFLPSVLILLCSLLPRYRDPQHELHRRYLLSCLPIYLLIDPMSGGLAYAPKTAFVGFLLCYCLSLIHNAQRPAVYRALVPTINKGMPHHG